DSVLGAYAALCDEDLPNPCGQRSIHMVCQAEDGVRDLNVTGVQTCALPIGSVMRIVAGNNILKKYNIEVCMCNLQMFLTYVNIQYRSIQPFMNVYREEKRLFLFLIAFERVQK